MFSFKLANLCSIAKTSNLYKMGTNHLHCEKKNEKLFDIHILFMIKCFVFQNQYCNSICICINIKEQVNFGHCLCLEIEVHTWFIFNNYTGKIFRFRCCSQITPKQTLHLMEYPFGREMSKHCPFNIKPVSWHLICGRQWQSHLHSSTLY